MARRKYASPEAYKQVRALRSQAAVLRKQGLINAKKVTDLKIGFHTRGPKKGEAYFKGRPVERTRQELQDVVRGEARAVRLSAQQRAAIEALPERERPRVVKGRAVVSKSQAVTKRGRVVGRSIVGAKKVSMRGNWKQRIRDWYDAHPGEPFNFGFVGDGRAETSFKNTAEEMITYLESYFKSVKDEDGDEENEFPTDAIFLLSMNEYNALISKIDQRPRKPRAAKQSGGPKRKQAPRTALQRDRDRARQANHRAKVARIKGRSQ